MILIYLYLFILLFGLSFVILRKKTSILKGETFLKFNLIFLSISFVLLIIISVTSPPALNQEERGCADNAILVFAILTFVAFLNRHRWVLFKNDMSNTCAIIEDSLSRVLLNFNKQNKQKYAIQTIEKDVQLKLINVWPGLAIIVFKGNWNLKKVQVFRKFLIKNFETIFPRIKIRLQ
jgi:hypothetical protein